MKSKQAIFSTEVSS